MRIAILSFLIIFMSCASTKSSVSTKQIATLKNLVTNKNFEVNFDWAQPLGLNTGVNGLQSLMPQGSSVNNISITNNSNFFRVQKENIYMDLPYFGQQRMSRGYNSEIGIKFNGKTNKYKESFNEKKNAFILKYWLDGDKENYTVILTLFANNSSSLSINSSHRTTINYQGKWKEIIIKE